MIRYVLAVLVTVALLAVAIPAVDRAAAVKAERQAETVVGAVDASATSLVENEVVPPAGRRGAKRTVSVRFPGDSMASRRIALFRIRRITENASLATYRVAGRAEHRTRIAAPIENEAGGPVVLGGDPGDRTFHLTLERDDDGGPVVVLGRGLT